jgi:Cu+-exporting ATPase
LEESIPIYDVVKGDRLLIRNQELIPVDGILLSAEATLDYSFVTGEANAITKKSGDKVFAGGKQIGQLIEMQVLESVSQSYLTQLWSNDVFQKKVNQHFKTITDQISHYFTPILLLIAFAGFGYWIFFDVNTAFNVFTAVLIVACPCALALTAPFTFGNILRILGKKKIYLKNALVIEQLAKVDTLVFDKTGTITTTEKATIDYQGVEITTQQEIWIKNSLRASNHPLSRMLYNHLPEVDFLKMDDFQEFVGKGIETHFQGTKIVLGSAAFVGNPQPQNVVETSIHISINGAYLGKYVFKNAYRKGLSELFSTLSQKYQLHVLSGDNSGEESFLKAFLPPNTQLIFNQKPEQKLDYIKSLQDNGKNVMMIGDGLNDAGALAQSNVGISISENVNVFSPACDAILDASEFQNIGQFLKLSQKAIRTIKMSFALSLLYNVVGLAFAVTGNLLPLVAAIIMPLSTITIVSFVTVMSTFYAKKLNLK